MKPDTAFERALKTVGRFGEESTGTLSVSASAFAESVHASVAQFAGDDDYAVIQRNRDSLAEVNARDGTKARLHANPSLAAWNDALKRNRFMETSDNDGYLVDKRYRSWMLIPVFAKKELALAVIVARKKGRFGEEEARAAERLGEWFTQTLRDMRRRNKRVAAIAEDARHGMLLQTQESLCKNKLEWNGFAQATDFASRTGSDFAKAWKTSDGGLMMVVCDVTAGDMERQAALVYLDAWLTLLARTTLDARGMLERLNADMLRRIAAIQPVEKNLQSAIGRIRGKA